MSAIVINPYAYGGAATQYNRIPLKMLKAVPAGFPLPIHDDYFDAVGHSNAIFSNIQSGGEDLRAFTDLAMTNEIPIEVISVTTGSNLIKGYVRVPSALAINDKIYLRTTVGGGESAYAVTATNGRNNVWQDYELVLHGNDFATDVTGNNTTVTETGTADKSGADLINGWAATGFGAREGSASTDRVEWTDPPTYSEVCTETMVFFKEGTEDSTAGRIVQRDGANNQNNKRPGDGLLGLRPASTTDQLVRDLAAPITDDTWNYFGIIWPAIASTPTYRFNGGLFGSPTVQDGAGTITSITGDWIFGNISAGTAPLDGRMAEYRYRADNTPDADWLDLEWDTFNDPGSIAEAEALVVV